MCLNLSSWFGFVFSFSGIFIYIFGDDVIRCSRFRIAMLPLEWILFLLHPSLSLMMLSTLKYILSAVITATPASFQLMFTW